MTLYRKIEKLSFDSMDSEIAFSITNKVDSRSQCLQIMQDHKNCDQLLALGVKNLQLLNIDLAIKLHQLRGVCNELRDKIALMIEHLHQKTKLHANLEPGTDTEIQLLKYKNEIFDNLMKRNQDIKSNRQKYVKKSQPLIV